MDNYLGFDDDNEESDLSVAEGLGMTIDDEGNWIPLDDNDISRFM